jgi:hypothetical protein
MSAALRGGPAKQFRIRWVDGYREPQVKPNPGYPTGVDLDLSGGAIACCTAELPYPARRCGLYVVVCLVCGYSVSCTTAGRADDPRSLTMPCAPTDPAIVEMSENDPENAKP